MDVINLILSSPIWRDPPVCSFCLYMVFITYFNRINFREIKLPERKKSRNFLDLISRIRVLKNFTNEHKNNWKKPFFAIKLRLLTGFSTKNAILKISRGFNFANELSQTISRVLFPRKWRKFAKPRNLISRKLIRLKYLMSVLRYLCIN